jgi:hypothetical protein
MVGNIGISAPAISSMTLILCLRPDDGPVLLGDCLLSSENGNPAFSLQSVGIHRWFVSHVIEDSLTLSGTSRRLMPHQRCNERGILSGNKLVDGGRHGRRVRTSADDGVRLWGLQGLAPLECSFWFPWVFGFRIYRVTATMR